MRMEKSPCKDTAKRVVHVFSMCGCVWWSVCHVPQAHRKVTFIYMSHMHHFFQMLNCFLTSFKTVQIKVYAILLLCQKLWIDNKIQEINKSKNSWLSLSNFTSNTLHNGKSSQRACEQKPKKLNKWCEISGSHGGGYGSQKTLNFMNKWN
jgi:hypothetical protein